MGVISYSPLSGGWLSGRYRSDRQAAGPTSAVRQRLSDRFDLSMPANQRKLEAVDRLTSIAEQADISLVEMAIEFVLRHPAITASIIGQRTMGHLESYHPMDVLRTAVSIIGASDLTFEDTSVAANLNRSLNLMTKLPTIVAFDQRRRHDKDAIEPDPNLGFAANFLYTCFGSVPEPDMVSAFEDSLIFYAEHGFNASTFTGRVVTSTMPGLYTAVTAAIGALQDPLHGGASEAVMYMLREIEEPAKAAQ